MVYDDGSAFVVDTVGDSTVPAAELELLEGLRSFGRKRDSGCGLKKLWDSRMATKHSRRMQVCKQEHAIQEGIVARTRDTRGSSF